MNTIWYIHIKTTARQLNQIKIIPVNNTRTISIYFSVGYVYIIVGHLDHTE